MKEKELNNYKDEIDTIIKNFRVKQKLKKSKYNKNFQKVYHALVLEIKKIIVIY